MITQRGRSRILGGIILVETEVFLWRVRQQAAENLGTCQGLVEFLGVRDHDQGPMIATFFNAFTASLAEIGDKNGEHTAATGIFLLNVAEDGGDLVVGDRDNIQNRIQLGLRLVGNGAVEGSDLFLYDLLEWQFFLGLSDFDHPGTRCFLNGGDVAD